ncbi:MAG: segregation/condensation protein A [Acidobacteriota bacterium]|nr:segregation/condensation protein A [Acidobacteriota bacterium]MDH3524254.1 segregation/condensation protein A [Acidobacteriota bacterium]
MTTTSRASGALPPEWQVRLPEFEGPLDLLLHLVRVNEVEITEISVAQICDQFHETLRLMERFNLDVAADYIYEAAQLIFLKSRMLLPRRKTVDGEDAEGDPREELVQRLLEYRRLKEAAQSLAEIHGLRRGVWTRGRQAASFHAEEGVDLGEVSLYDLLGALKTVLVRYDFDHPDAMHLRADTFSVRDQFEALLLRLDPQRPLDLIADLKSRGGRAEVVSAFLAVLEMIRLGLVRLHATGGDILLYRTPKELQRHELEAIRA